LENANFNDENLTNYKNLKLQDVILIRKNYDRPNKRFWKLKNLEITKNDDYDYFLDELEEDKEMRSKIEIFKGLIFNIKFYKDSKMDVEEIKNSVNKNIPDSISLEELLDDLKL
jgi:nonsense-mediated mRNA decay protein 3